MYGGPLFNGVRLPDGQGGTREIKVNLADQLNSAYAKRTGHHGLFIIKQICTADGPDARESFKTHFVDATIWVNDVTDEVWENLKRDNNTEVTAGSPRWLKDYENVLNGWGQMIYYKMRVANYFPSAGNQLDPTKPDNNIFERVFEGQLV